MGVDGEHGAMYDRAFTYKRADRLITATNLTALPGETINSDPEEGDVTTEVKRTYTFDKNGNRTRLSTTTNGVQTASRTWVYDGADRVGVNDGYVYDGLGRQTTIPAADAPTRGENTTGSDITISYYDDDAAASITRDGVTTTYERDPAGRRLTIETTGASTSKTVTQHYTDDSDNPTWSTQVSGQDTTLTRYETTIGGDLSITIGDDGVVSLAISNPNRDVVTTVPLTGDQAGLGVSGWSQYDEYGNQLSQFVNTGVTSYGWKGAAQRALDTESGLILMGARLYNSVTGSFTSVDPVAGGNTTAYTYPQDPINKEDLGGQMATWKKWAIGIGVVAAVAAGVALCIWATFACMNVARAAVGLARVAKPIVPRVSKTSKSAQKYAKTTYGNYTIKSKGIFGRTYKHGITRQSNLHARPQSQLKACAQYYGRTCTYKLKKTTGYVAARTKEAKKIQGYVNRRGKCPPGARSCR